MEKIHYSSCPFCHSDNINKVLNAKDFLVSNNEFEIWHCNHCGFRFTQDIPTLDKIGGYYKSENYISHSDTKKGLLNHLYHMARNYMLSVKYKHITTIGGKQKGNLLDIGAGTGYFVNYMNNRGFKAEGIEIDADARKVAEKNFGIKLLPVDTLYKLPEEKYDIITMWHVLEHIHDLEGYMHKIKTSLKKDGTFVCALPNYTSYDGSHYKENWAAYDVPRHLWHFSPEFFQQFAAMYGFEVIEIKPMPLDAVYISILSEKIKKSNTLAGMIKGSFFMFKSLFNKHKASSIIYFLKKV